MSGKIANEAGSRAERAIACMLFERGLLYKRHKVIGTSIYGHNLRVDFFVENIPEYPEGLIIESKWQDATGSVDEKFPYLVENIVKRYPCPAIVVVAGGGQKPGSVEWLRNQVDGEKLVGVYNLEEFLSWLNRECSDPSTKQCRINEYSRSAKRTIGSFDGGRS